MTILNELSTVKLHGQSNVHTLDDPELFNYSVAYLTEPGYWIRRHGSRGTAHVAGERRIPHRRRLLLPAAVGVFERACMRAARAAHFPLDVSHPVFNTFFRITTLDGMTHPDERARAQYSASTRTTIPRATAGRSSTSTTTSATTWSGRAKAGTRQPVQRRVQVRDQLHRLRADALTVRVRLPALRRSAIVASVVAAVVAMGTLSATHGYAQRWRRVLPGAQPALRRPFYLRSDQYTVYRRSGWEFDYPTMERNLMTMMQEVTSLRPARGRAATSTRWMTPSLLNYPVAYLSEPGYWRSRTKARSRGCGPTWPKAGS